MSDISTILKEAVTDTINQFQGNPFDFLYESDLEGLLYSILREKCRNLSTTFKYSGDTKDSEKDSEDTSINPVKTHYPCGPHGQHMDIVILETGGIGDSKIKAHAESLYGAMSEAVIPWHLPVSCAVELKYSMVGYSSKEKLDLLCADLKKLEHYADTTKKAKLFIGWGILFVQTEELWKPLCEKYIQSPKPKWTCGLPNADSEVFGIVVPPFKDSKPMCWRFACI